jgi:hypothetical protein
MRGTEDEQNHLVSASTLSMIGMGDVDAYQHELLAYATRALPCWSAHLDSCADV